MMLRPRPLSEVQLSQQELKDDKKSCRKIGPCGTGAKALYLNSFFIDRCYYIPYSAIQRVFKRVAMSEGGFSGKGMFASMAYLVVEYDHGRQKQCNFKYEEQVDELLERLAQDQPQIRLVSAKAEAKLAEREEERRREMQSRPQLSAQASKEVERLERAASYLEKKPVLSNNLSSAARRRRAYQCSSPSYRWFAMAVTLLGAASLIYGIYSVCVHNGFAVYFALFGLAAIFTFAGFSVLPTARNNKKAVMQYDENAREKMAVYLEGYPGFPLPARYAHPVVLRRMERVIRQGRASNLEHALDVVKEDLKALNSQVQVSQEEYDEVVAIKAMFLNAGYE